MNMLSISWTNMYIVIVFNLKWQGVWCRRLEERSPCVPGAVIKDICITVHIVLLGFFLLDLWISRERGRKKQKKTNVSLQISTP